MLTPPTILRFLNFVKISISIKNSIKILKVFSLSSCVYLCIPDSYQLAFCKVNAKVVPMFGVLRTEIVCSCASKICLTIASPSPVPPS